MAGDLLRGIKNSLSAGGILPFQTLPAPSVKNPFLFSPQQTPNTSQRFVEQYLLGKARDGCSLPAPRAGNEEKCATIPLVLLLQLCPQNTPEGSKGWALVAPRWSRPFPIKFFPTESGTDPGVMSSCCKAMP